MTSRRWLLAAVSATVAAQIVIWLVAGSITWTYRDLMVGTGSKEAADNTRFAIAIFVGAGVNGAAFLAFLFRQRGWGWLLLMAVQIADVAIALAGGALINPWWWLMSLVGAVAVLLLFLLRRAPAPRPHCE
jgi:hypothetical protein